MSAKQNRKGTKQTLNPKTYGGVFPYPPQWMTIFAVACDDMGLLFKQSCGLGLTQARLLYEASYHRYENRVSEVAQALYIKRTTAANAVKQLCSRGLLEETINEADGRSRVLALSDTGRSCVALMENDFLTYIQRLKETLSSSQYKQLMQAGLTIAQNNTAAYMNGTMVLEAPTYLSAAALRVAFFTELSRSLGFSFSEIRLLAALITMPAAPRMSTLSSRLSLRQNEISVAVDALEQKACVSRFADPGDKRAVRIYNTEYGYKVCSRFAAGLIASVATPHKLFEEIPYPATARLFPTIR